MSTSEKILGVVIVLAFLALVAAVVFRVLVVRGSATPVLLSERRRPAWRYGALRYSEDEACFYRLVSLRPGADLRIERRSIELGARRRPEGAELEVAEDGEVIVRVSGTRPGGAAVDVDLCLAPRDLTALLSWVEACSTETVRRRPRRGRSSRR